MLSNEWKNVMAMTIAGMKKDGMFAEVCRRGPAFWVQESIKEATESKRPQLQNLIDNRQEAEQYLAGLLGMM